MVEPAKQPQLLSTFKPKFDNFSRDKDRIWDVVLAECDAGRVAKPAGRSLYSVYGETIHDWLQEQYFARGLHDAIEAVYTPAGEMAVGWPPRGMREIAERFVALGELHRAWRLWRTHLALVRDAFWQAVAYRDRGFAYSKFNREPERKQRASFENFVAAIAKDKELLLGVHAAAREFFVQSGAGASEIARLDCEIAKINVEKRALAPGKPDPRPMDENLFWEILEGGETGAIAERLDTLPERLAGLKPKAIKDFDAVLRDKFEAIYRTDVWALAFLLRGGCSDDAFMEFRAWLILLGRRAYEGVVADPDRFDVALFDGTGATSLSLLDAPSIAYELRAGKPMPQRRRIAPDLEGPEIEEENFRSLLPRIAKAVAAT